MASVNYQTINFFAGDQEASGAFWQQAGVVGGQYRQVNKLLAVLQSGAGEAGFNSGTSLAVVVLGLAGTTVSREYSQVAITAVAATAGIQLDALQTERVNTKTYGALSEAGFVDGFQA